MNPDALRTRCVWSDFSKKQFHVYFFDGDTHPLELGPGDCVTWQGRDGYVRIVDVAGIESAVGPMGFAFLPYRHLEGRWASPVWTLRGDARFAICYPEGYPHYGLHLPLHTLRKDEAPPYTGRFGISLMSDKFIVEVRYHILDACQRAKLDYRVDDSTYHCSTGDAEFDVVLTRLEDCYRIDICHVSGNKDVTDDYSRLLNL